MTDWNNVRKLFPALKSLVYLNAASGSPICSATAKAAQDFYSEMLKYGDMKWMSWLDKKEDTRNKVANFINAEKEEIAFNINTSFCMNIIADILKGKGEILTMYDEFPSSTIPWLHKGFKTRFVKPTNYIYSLDDIEKSITSKTKILISSHVQYRTGFRQDLTALGRICKKHNLIFVVNATQSLGVIPVDVRKANIDFLTFSSHKWMMSGYGISGLFINKKHHGKIKYPIAGWLSVHNPEKMLNTNTEVLKAAYELEAGCMHFPNIFALGASIDFFNSIGKSNIEKRIIELTDYLIGQIEKLKLCIITPKDKKFRSGIIIVKISDAERIVAELEKKKILVAARGEGIRISSHVYNNFKDIDKLISELQKLI